MKSLVISTAILLLVIFASIFGAIFTEKKLGEFENDIESAISDDTDDADAIASGAKIVEERYENIGKYLRLLIHDDEVREIEEHIEDIKSAATNSEVSDAITAKNRLILHIRQLRRLSKFSPEAIF